MKLNRATIEDYESIIAFASNTPAHKIYKALGFEYRGKQHLYAENTGWTDFYFFEYCD